MYTLLRVTDDKIYYVVDWNTNKVDSISEEEMIRRLEMGFEVEGVELTTNGLSIHPAVSLGRGLSLVKKFDCTDVLGVQVSMLISYAFVDAVDTLSIAFHVDDLPLYEDTGIRGTVLYERVEQRINIQVYPKVQRTGFIDTIDVSEMKLLHRDSKFSLFQLTLSSMDEHFYGEDLPEHLCMDFILAYNPESKMFLYVYKTPWRKKDSDIGTVVVDEDNKSLVIKGTCEKVYTWR